MGTDDRDGLLLVAKPVGPTSHDVVAIVRRCLGRRRVGHAGTLDPLASGLLPLVVGRATRLVRFLPHSPKSYRGVLVLGRTTDTDDVTGETVHRHDGELPEPGRVAEVSAGFVGRSLQRPPDYSARKVAGERAYRLARRGQTFETAPSEIVVERFDVRPGDAAGTFDFHVVVSRGTYVRALVRDLGAQLGCGATMSALERTRIGPLELERATSWPPERGPDQAALIDATLSMEQMPLEARTVSLVDDETARRFVQGLAVPVGTPQQAGLLRVLHPNGDLLGVGETTGTLVRPKVVVAAATAGSR